jgi:hypothetical protein
LFKWSKQLLQDKLADVERDLEWLSYYDDGNPMTDLYPRRFSIFKSLCAKYGFNKANKSDLMQEMSEVCVELSIEIEGLKDMPNLPVARKIEH